MLKRLLKTTLALLPLFCPTAAQAHVKWFLSKSEAELLAQPKPDLFVHLRWDNGLVGMLVAICLYLAHRLNRKLSAHPLNKKLAATAGAFDPYIQLFIGIFTGLVLLYCAQNMTFFVPNLHLHSCCKWIARTEALVGLALILGLMARPAAAAMLFLLGFSFLKFPLNDCADLLPMYGIALYVLIAGRGKFSVDYLIGVAGGDALPVCEISTAVLRIAVGLGLICLGLDEKLINPQLALNLLQQHPVLNFMHIFGMSNDLFILISGFVEVSLGICLTFGIFPRLAITALAGLFCATTLVFGSSEFIGHMPYYAIFIAVFLRGANITASAADWRALFAIRRSRRLVAAPY